MLARCCGFLLAMPAAWIVPAAAQSLQVTGQAGYLGEWELRAMVTRIPATANHAYVGQIVLRHVGICAQGGSPVKGGQIRLELIGRSGLRATFSLDETVCSYSGERQSGYNGFMRCGDGNTVPLRLHYEAVPD
jgi:hypothetical protein